ncbi:hypothetical protein [Burkholderia ubonensis]|uniref:hypothetical protein n=1 Tax=Burkholderia ubonensis TaxID=101571 RepID=UPI0012FCC1BA|nr:hypothetical protein [Burkholderia ubonensis]
MRDGRHVLFHWLFNWIIDGVNLNIQTAREARASIQAACVFGRAAEVRRTGRYAKRRVVRQDETARRAMARKKRRPPHDAMVARGEYRGSIR